MKIDLRRYEPGERGEALFEAFSALSAGSAIHFISDRDERHLLDQLYERRVGGFEWHLLAANGELHEFVLARSPNARNRGHQVTEQMKEEHEQIHALIDQITKAARRGSRPQAQRLCEELGALLGEHIEMEERLLVPLVAERLASLRGPAAVMRDEHLAIEGLVEQLKRAAHDPQISVYEIARISGDLTRVLVKHTEMEETVLYGIVDLLLAPQEREELFRRWREDAE